MVLLSEHLFRHFVGWSYYFAFISSLSTLDAYYSCSGLFPIAGRVPGTCLHVNFMMLIAGGVFATIASTARKGSWISLVMCWLIFFWDQYSGLPAKDLFFQNYDILLLEMGLYAILFDGLVGQAMSGWCLFRFIFGSAMSLLSCDNSPWWDLKWFQEAYKSEAPTSLMWFTNTGPPILSAWLTAFVLLTFLTSAFSIWLLPNQAPRYIFWAGVLYFGFFNNYAWLPVLLLGLTSHLASDATMLDTYPRVMWNFLGKIPEKVQPDSFGVSDILGWVLYLIVPVVIACGVPVFSMVKSLDVTSTIFEGLGAYAFILHLGLLVARCITSQSFTTILAIPVSALGLIGMYPENALVKALPIPYLTREPYFEMGPIIPAYTVGTTCAAYKVNGYRAAIFHGAVSGSRGDNEIALKHNSGLGGDFSKRPAFRFPFPSRIETAITRILQRQVKSNSKDMPEWFSSLMHGLMWRDKSILQLFEESPLFENSEENAKKTIESVHAFTLSLIPTTGRTEHRWWEAKGEFYGRENKEVYHHYARMNRKDNHNEHCNPTPWVDFPFFMEFICGLFMVIKIIILVCKYLEYVPEPKIVTTKKKKQ